MGTPGDDALNRFSKEKSCSCTGIVGAYVGGTLGSLVFAGAVILLWVVGLIRRNANTR